MPHSLSLDYPSVNGETMMSKSKTSGNAPQAQTSRGPSSHPGTLIFGITRNAARESKYDWITHLLTNSSVMITQSNIGQINTFEEAEKLESIGAFTIRYDRLKELGWGSVAKGNDATNFNKLKKNRLDAVWRH